MFQSKKKEIKIIYIDGQEKIISNVKKYTMDAKEYAANGIHIYTTDKKQFFIPYFNVRSIEFDY